MNSLPDRTGDAAVAAAHELAWLQDRVERARVELTQLQQQLVESEHRLGDGLAAQLVEVNEQLLSATLQARTDAETATQALEDVSRLVELDALTQLPNRLLLLDRVAQTVATAKRHGTRFALLFVDLDNFKQINDTLGHAVGDDVLRRTAQCLVSAVRDEDTVSRHGGDEFLILLAEVGQAADAVVVAEKVMAALAAPYHVGEHPLRLSASIGISVYPDDGEEVETLIECADAAMYRAKRHGLGFFVFSGGDPSRECSPQSPQPGLADPLRAYPPPAEQKLRHAQIREANEQLVRSALDAQGLQSTAEQANRQQADFLAVLAHELRNPLTPIRTAAGLLGRVRTDELPRLQAIIERQVLHISRLLNDLLDVSRASTGKLRIERRSVDLAGVIDEAVDACRSAIDARGQHLRVQVPASDLVIHGDPLRLAQIVSNLLDNASKYTPDGGDIALIVTAADKTLVLAVTDSGIGITAEALPSVFEPFMQHAAAVGFNGTGLGIGLTVVRELVEAHGGQVVASSAGSGQGSRFVVTLPQAERRPLSPG
ncbi:diguanylate cyclase domain-containing protein [Lysobacter koreensis]|uniref:histidine kinase n=1 Tax=Lysobacter koreensis TaxID=266122 RepID=A0ABW2YQU8_9GAMM